jgi:hypothetical protein
MDSEVQFDQELFAPHVDNAYKKMFSFQVGFAIMKLFRQLIHGFFSLGAEDTELGGEM